jgi:hypothetical protein
MGSTHSKAGAGVARVVLVKRAAAKVRRVG